MKTGEDFFTWVGKCITSWANVEERLFAITMKSIGSTKTRAAIIFYSTPTIGTRLRLTDELVRNVLPPREKKDGGKDHPDVKIWDDLRKEIGDLLPIRNRIAHQPVKDITYPALSAVTALFDQMTWYQSHVSEAEMLRGRNDDAKPIGVVELSQHRIAVELITAKLDLFISHILSKYA